jgi:DNA-binding MarR family transcriptional regulator
MLAQIPGESRFFQMRTKGHEALINVMKKGCLSPESLYLKLGASVMFTKNNQKEGFVNGTLGIVEDFSGDLGLPVVRTRSGRRIVVSPADWTVEEDGKIKGTINQLPLRLAWAITVHKSQGISLDEAVIDLSKVFEFGQGYVALSRVRRLSGIYLLGWNEVAFQVDPEILKKDREFQIESGEAEKFFARITLAELEKMLVDFIVSCDGEVKESDVRPRKSRKKTSTIDETLILWKEGKSIKEIASLRELSEKTIFSHLEDLVKAERINQSDLRRAASPKLLEALPQIQIAFKKLKTEKLTPVYEHFRGKYSYDELKLARLLMTK